MTYTLTHRVYIDGVFSGYQMQSPDGGTRLLFQNNLSEVCNGGYHLTNARCIRLKPEFRWEDGPLALRGIDCRLNQLPVLKFKSSDPEVYCHMHYKCRTCATRDVPNLCAACIQQQNFCWYKKRRRESL